MSEVYAEALAFGAHALAEFLSASEQLKTTGMFCTSAEGGAYLHPLVGVRNKAYERFLEICREFGFTPASKTRLKAGGAQETDKTDGKSRFFSQVG